MVGEERDEGGFRRRRIRWQSSRQGQGGGGVQEEEQVAEQQAALHGVCPAALAGGCQLTLKVGAGNVAAGVSGGAQHMEMVGCVWRGTGRAICMKLKHSRHGTLFTAAEVVLPRPMRLHPQAPPPPHCLTHPLTQLPPPPACGQVKEYKADLTSLKEQLKTITAGGGAAVDAARAELVGSKGRGGGGQDSQRGRGEQGSTEQQRSTITWVQHGEGGQGSSGADGSKGAGE